VTKNIIDISHWEEPVDFAKVSGDGILAVIAKSTTGAPAIDLAYAACKAAAAPYNVLWG